MIYNELALVWRDNEIHITRKLNKVSEEEYNNLSKLYGRPIGRTEKFLDLSRFYQEKEKSQLEKLMEN